MQQLWGLLYNKINKWPWQASRSSRSYLTFSVCLVFASCVTVRFSPPWKTSLGVYARSPWLCVSLGTLAARINYMPPEPKPSHPLEVTIPWLKKWHCRVSRSGRFLNANDLSHFGGCWTRPYASASGLKQHRHPDIVPHPRDIGIPSMLKLHWLKSISAGKLASGI